MRTTTTTESQAARMTAGMLDRERATLAREAQDIAATAARIARDVEGALACGDVNRLSQQMQQLLIRATRTAAMQETATLYEAEIAAK